MIFLSILIAIVLFTCGLLLFDDLERYESYYSEWVSIIGKIISLFLMLGGIATFILTIAKVIL